MSVMSTISDRGIYIFTTIVSATLMFTLRSMPLNTKIFPIALLVLLISVSLISLASGRGKFAKIDLRRYRMCYAVYAFFVLYVVSLPFVGYFIGTACFLFIAMTLLKPNSSKVAGIIIAFLLAISLKVCFSVFFQVPLP